MVAGLKLSRPRQRWIVQIQVHGHIGSSAFCSAGLAWLLIAPRADRRAMGILLLYASINRSCSSKGDGGRPWRW